MMVCGDCVSCVSDCETWEAGEAGEAVKRKRGGGMCLNNRREAPYHIS